MAPLLAAIVTRNTLQNTHLFFIQRFHVVVRYVSDLFLAVAVLILFSVGGYSVCSTYTPSCHRRWYCVCVHLRLSLVKVKIGRKMKLNMNPVLQVNKRNNVSGGKNRLSRMMPLTLNRCTIHHFNCSLLSEPGLNSWPDASQRISLVILIH